MARPAITLLLLDLNGVLYRYDRGARIAHLAALAGLPPESIQAAIWDSGFEDSGDAGTLGPTAYLDGFGARIGHALSETDWLAAHQAALTPITASLALLPRIRPGIRLAVLTNNNLLVQRHFATLYPEVATLVGHRAHVSAEFGARKPDPDAFLRCLARLDATPAETLFIDDSPANVAGARKAKLLGYDYVDPEAMASEFRHQGVLPDD